MTVKSRKRRRWLYGLGVAAILVAGAILGWPLRPLNATERRLVGTWVIRRDGEQFMVFRADRRLAYANGIESFEEIATWKAGEWGLEIHFHADEARIAKKGLIARLEALFGRLQRRKPSVLRFHSDDRALIYGLECRRMVK